MLNEIFIKHHQIGLRIIGAWPTCPLIMGYYFGMGISVFLMIFAVWNVVEVYDDLEVLMDNLVSSIGCVLGLCKITIFYLKHKSLTLVINTISDDHLQNSKCEEPRSEVMLQNSTRSQLISKCIIVMYNSMNMTYVLRTLASYVVDEVQDRKFLAQVTFPVDARQSPLYEFIFIGQVITASICFNSNAFIEGMLVTAVLHASSKINLVQREISTFSTTYSTNMNDRTLTLVALKRLVQKHLEFVKFSQVIQEIFSPVTFFHIFSLTLLQVTSAYLFLDGLEKGSEPIILIHNATLAMSLLVSTGYYCIVGEYLTNQSEVIFNDLYNCMWYTFSNQDKKAVNFMLAKAREPVHLTVGKFSNLSLIYLTSIMKTSFSYLSVVRAAR
ncbi:odorant receptor Or2-like isoform X1 [Phymastichus coffea]|uniref:odorant receptor Or2-like isoform X1 n=1 Tax=Phymastichus coffea TaxID=108790 RepID=UPI00273BAB63|nr:odorant receptor Or2-like isoform X1 [Phymastichus coffea]